MIELIKKIKNKTKKRNVRIYMVWQREKDQIFFFFFFFFLRIRKMRDLRWIINEFVWY